MPSIPANTFATVLLHLDEILTLTMTAGGTAAVIELDNGGNFVAQTNYSLSPTAIGGYLNTKSLRILAVNGIVTYTVTAQRDASLAEQRIGGQSGVQVATVNNTAEQVLATIPIIGGLLGVNGVIRVSTLWTLTNNVNVKTLRVRLGGVAGTIFWAVAGASIATLKGHCQIANRGAQASQVAMDSATLAFGSSTGAVVTGTIDTSINQDLVITAQKATGTDTTILEAYQVEICPGQV